MIFVQNSSSREQLTADKGGEFGSESFPAAVPIAIDKMKEALRAADCLYDKAEIYARLGAKQVPAIPDAVIKEAYEKGGRVILRCSSISEKTDALRKAGHSVVFYASARQSDYVDSVSEPQWIVVQSHIDKSTVGHLRSAIVTADSPAPTTEDWFATGAYAKIDGGRNPQGGGNFGAFTSEPGTGVVLDDGGIIVVRDVALHDRWIGFGAVRFGHSRI